MATGEKTTFNITVTMQDRWIPHFLAMLKQMQLMGSWGCTRIIRFVSDGDGDFRPTFEWSSDLPVSTEYDEKDFDERVYDAG